MEKLSDKIQDLLKEDFSERSEKVVEYLNIAYLLQKQIEESPAS